MDLWSNQCVMVERMENSHHLKGFVELPQRGPLQLQRAYDSHGSKVHCSVAPHDKTDRVCSFQEVDTLPPLSREYFHFVFFLAEEVPLPDRKSPADLNTCLPLSLLPHEVPLLPNPLPLQTKDKMNPDLSNVGFLSLHDEVACLVSEPLSVTAGEVPLPPSPQPAVAVLRVGDTHENNNSDLKNIAFSSLGDEVTCLMFKPLSLLPHEVSLPPSPPLAEATFHMGDTSEKKNPDLKNIGLPSRDDEVAGLISQPHSVMACEGPLPLTPPPADAALHVRYFHEKKYPDLRNIEFSSLDRVIKPKHPDLLPFQVPLPPSPPPVEIADMKYLNCHLSLSGL